MAKANDMDAPCSRKGIDSLTAIFAMVLTLASLSENCQERRLWLVTITVIPEIHTWLNSELNLWCSSDEHIELILQATKLLVVVRLQYLFEHVSAPFWCWPCPSTGQQPFASPHFSLLLMSLPPVILVAPDRRVFPL